jgi:mannan endo-1,4-beta-mannosidase
LKKTQQKKNCMIKSLKQWLLQFAAVALAICFTLCSKKNGGEPAPPVTPPLETVPSLSTVQSWLADKNATAQTAALFYNMKKLSKTKVLFGHQDATKRGYNWANEQHLPAVSRERSDVKEVTGAYPAVYGHDFLHIANFTDGNWFDYEKQVARELTIDAYNRGGINTYAWHYNNPVSQGSFYWSQSPVEAVSKIIPGGSHHEVYKNSLREVADFARSLVAADGKLVPVIFRPFHEMDGDWFWWGSTHCTPDQYKILYRFTVIYLRDSLQVRNFLYGWSPDKNFTSEAQYLERYPGDEYVDLVGCDNYGDVHTNVQPSVAAGKLEIVSNYAKKKNKIAAMTETGLQNLPQSDWYTQKLLKILQQRPLELSYVLAWANTSSAFWTPYPGHAAAQDFIAFKNNPYMIFGDKLPDMYKLQ